MKFYAVATEDRETSWWAAQCANLPGCFTQAPTKADLIKRLAEAAGTCLAIRMRRGRSALLQEVALGELYLSGLDVLEIDLAPDQMIRWTADPSLDSYQGEDDPYIYADDGEQLCHALLQLVLGYSGVSEGEFFKALGTHAIQVQPPAGLPRRAPPAGPARPGPEGPTS